MSDMAAAPPVASKEKSAPAISRVVEVHGPVVDIACEKPPPLHRALTVAIDGANATLEVLHHLDCRRRTEFPPFSSASVSLIGRRWACGSGRRRVRATKGRWGGAVTRRSAWPIKSAGRTTA